VFGAFLVQSALVRAASHQITSPMACVRARGGERGGTSCRVPAPWPARSVLDSERVPEPIEKCAEFSASPISTMFCEPVTRSRSTAMRHTDLWTPGMAAERRANRLTLSPLRSSEMLVSASGIVHVAAVAIRPGRFMSLRLAIMMRIATCRGRRDEVCDNVAKVLMVRRTRRICWSNGRRRRRTVL